MSNDYERLASSLFQGKAPQNLDSLKEMLSTKESRRILSSVLADGGSAVKRAAEDAKHGDMSSAKSLIETLAKTPGGAELIANVARAVEGNK